MIYLLLTSIITGVQILLERSLDPDLRARNAGRDWLGRKRPGVPAVSVPHRPVSRVEAVRELIRRRRRWRPMHHSCNAPNVWKAYGDRDVLRGISFTVKPGEVVAVIGPSGSGKSTLLRLINHLESLDQGDIRVGGRYVGYVQENGRLKPTSGRAKARAEVGVSMVFQQFNLFSNLTALENIMEAPVRVHGVPQDEAEALARRLLAVVGLSSHADHLPQHLSGGQQQRVAIARALAVKPGSCCSTSRHRRSIPNWSARCSMSCAASPRPA